MTHTPDCTCYYGVTDETPPVTTIGIIHCPMHKATPELLEACNKALDGMYNQFPQYETMTSQEMRHPDMACYAVEVILDIRAAIAKAEGRIDATSRTSQQGG